MAKKDSRSLKHTKSILERIEEIKRGKSTVSEEKPEKLNEDVEIEDNVDSVKEDEDIKDKDNEELTEGTVDKKDGGEIDLGDIESGDFVRVKDPEDNVPAGGFGAVDEVGEDRILIAFPDEDSIWFDIDEVEFVSKNPARESVSSDVEDKETVTEDKESVNEDRSPKKVEDIIPTYVYESAVQTLNEFQITANYDEEDNEFDIDDKEAKYFEITTENGKFIVDTKFETLTLETVDSALKELDEVAYILEQVRRDSHDNLF